MFIFAPTKSNIFIKMCKHPVSLRNPSIAWNILQDTLNILAPKQGSFGVCFLPHIISLICGLSFLIPASLNSVYLGKFNLFGILFTYFGISCLVNCFPLLEDAMNMWEHLFKDENTKVISKIGLAIPAAIMYAGAYLEHYFITIITTLGFAYAIPYIFALFIK